MSEKKFSALAEYFKSKGVTQSAIAEKLGVSKAYVNSLMNGKKAFGKAQAAKWGDLYGLSPSWLLTGEDKQTMPVLIDKRLKGDYLLFEVSGDSMDDGTSTAFLDGDVLLCRVLPKSDWQYGIKRRRDTYCVVATEAEGIVLKEVVNHDKATNEITCHSLNSQYKDYSVKLDDVQGIFYVEELIKRRF